jgi:hypothetical protein
VTENNSFPDPEAAISTHQDTHHGALGNADRKHKESWGRRETRK